MSLRDAPPISLVLVDFDDTLVETAPRFHAARRELFDLLGTLGFDSAEAYRLHHEVIDPLMLERHGLGPARLRHSFPATYAALCEAAGSAPAGDVLDQCVELGSRVSGPPPAIDGALDALQRLARRHRTVLYTQAGDPDYQRSCVVACGVLGVLEPEAVHICERKTAAALRATMAAFGAEDPTAVWMVGNSMRSDINPALEVGANAILVEVAEPWEFDMVEPVSDRFERVASFTDAVSLLLRFSRNAG